MGTYVKKTNWRRQEDRQLSIRAELRDPPDYQKLTELLIRLSLRDASAGQDQSPEHCSGTRGSTRASR
ncbi:hypothetical protein [Brevibacterium epidermidis]|uniref:hypothetical protein n=1 Tax=Brevibacterium epidermidis TaxID=1698 RepID=UPI000BF75B9C|nr:hypothetical protein [Brevibacterium epidermidis]